MFFTIVYALQWATIIGLFAGVVYAFMQKPSRLQNDIILLEIAALLMVVGYCVEITAETLDRAMLGAAVSYIGKPFTMVASLLFVLRYCGYRVSNRLKLALISFASVFPVFVFTNHYHYLYYSTVEFNPQATYSPLVLGHGPLYYLYMATILVFAVVVVVIAVREFMRCSTKAEKQSILWIFAMIGAAVMGYVAYLIDNTSGYDYTMAGVTLGAVILFLLFYRYRIFDVVSVAKESALKNATGGLWVLDKRNHVAYANNLAKDLWNRMLTLESVLTMPEKTTLRDGERVYAVQKTVLSERDFPIGTMIELTDVTDSVNYAARLEADVEERSRSKPFSAPLSAVSPTLWRREAGRRVSTSSARGNSSFCWQNSCGKRPRTRTY